MKIHIDPDTLRGTDGFHRLGRDRHGRWWLVDPKGVPWFHRGVDSVGVPSAIDLGGDHGEVAIRENTVSGATGFVRELGFNAFGSWSSPSLLESGLPVSLLLHVRRVYPEGQIQTPMYKLLDIFDAGFERAYDQACAEVVGPRRDDANLIGWFWDNEPSWAQRVYQPAWGGNAYRSPSEPAPTLLQFLMAQPRERPSHRAAWRWICERHGGMRAVAQRWGIPFSDEASFQREHDHGLVLDGSAYDEDQNAFSMYYALTYFRVIASVIRRHDPNHLLLGPREGANPGPVILEAMREAFAQGWLDVLTLNCYRSSFRECVEAVHRPTGMPVLNGEFSWASDHFSWPFADGSDRDRPVLDRVTERATAALEGAIAHPALIGYSWFKFQHRFDDPELPHYGLVSHCNVLNRYNARLLRAINQRADGLATGVLEPRRTELRPICHPSRLPKEAEVLA